MKSNLLKTTQIANYLAHDNVLIFSQKKSGTTFTCNVLAFYNGLRWGEEVDFRRLPRGGVFRVTNGWAALDRAFKFAKAHPDELRLVHTHEARIANFDARGYRFALLLTRDPADYCVSFFHYFYLNRENKDSVPKDQAIREMISQYLTVNAAQKTVQSAAQNHMVLHYEDLTSNPAEALRQAITGIYGTCDAALLSEAIEMASVDRLKEFEAKDGRAVVAGPDFTGKHFVRSGKIGEYKEFFSPEEQNQITALLADKGYSAI